MLTWLFEYLVDFFWWLMTMLAHMARVLIESGLDFIDSMIPDTWPTIFTATMADVHSFVYLCNSYVPLEFLFQTSLIVLAISVVTDALRAVLKKYNPI